MASRKNGLVAAMDSLPWVVKLILCIPALDIVWAVYRIVKGVSKHSTLMVVIGILWIIPGIAIGWLFDLISTILFGRPKFFA